MPLVMGTAGHIDHGKTTLIKALTGIDCDRLVEEKKRGITIELGFAFHDLASGERLGIVDVPGHEKFVKNMVAGATGIDFVLLVIAADEGIMPQTREHLEICTLLGIDKGLVALTKTDMVDSDWLEMVTEDVGEYLANTFLAQAPLIPVSAHTGAGMDELRAEVENLASSIVPRRRTDLFRLPVDRVFTMKGYGTVVTGTMISGDIAVGEDVEVFPAGKKAKVRSLQSHGQAVETAYAGKRTAVNLQGLEVADIDKGNVLARPGTLFPWEVWDIEITCLKSASGPLKHRKEVHFHHGSSEVMARIYLLDRDQLLPGESAVCQVRFSAPMACVHGDRVVLRSFSPLRAIAGGQVINPMGRKVKRKSGTVDLLAGLATADEEGIVAVQVQMAGRQGIDFKKLLVAADLESKQLEKCLNLMSGKGLVFCFDKENKVYIHETAMDDLSSSLLDFLARFHKNYPMKAGVSRGELASGWGGELTPKLFHFVLDKLVKKGRAEAEGDLFKLEGHKVSLASDTAKLKNEILSAYRAGGQAPPNMKDVLEKLDVTAKEALPVFRLLMDEGELVKVKEDMYFAAKEIDFILGRLTEFFTENDEMAPADFKGLVGLSRKYAIPVLEYFDKEKITARVGDKRIFRKKSAG